MRIPVFEPNIGKTEIEYVTEAVRSGWVSSAGKFIPQFEDTFAKYIGCEHGIATSNGTTALHLALEAIGIKPKDEVIVPTLTFISSANVVRFCGAKVRFIDSVPDYWCLDVETLEDTITPATKAIMVVHLYGHPCDMGPILEIAQSRNLYVIEDCAEAHGAEYKNTKVGSFGDISCFSFYGNKIITTGEGGMCLTNNTDLAEKMQVLRSHGMNPQKKYWHDKIGFNYRITNLQAALGVAQMERIEWFIQKKRKIAKEYDKLLADIDSITLPIEKQWAKNVYWMYSILIEEKFALSRNQLTDKLAAAGIETRPFFHPVHILPPYNRNEKYPIAESLSERGLNLPSGTTLSLDHVREVCEVICNVEKDITI